jgi:hypothetical protein
MAKRSRDRERPTLPACRFARERQALAALPVAARSEDAPTQSQARPITLDRDRIWLALDAMKQRVVGER